MEIEELIKIVTSEVIKKIKEDTREHTKEKILILEKADNEHFSKVVEGFNEKMYEFVYLDSWSEAVDDYEFILVPILDNRELANISLGVPCGVKEKVIIDSILRGKKVYILENGIEYRKYNKTSNKVFFKMYEDYENKLMNFGIDIVHSFNNIIEHQDKNMYEEPEKISTEEKESPQCNESFTTEVDKKLLTESDIDKLYKSGIREIIIKNKTVLTPLAKDYIRIKNIIVK